MQQISPFSTDAYPYADPSSSQLYHTPTSYNAYSDHGYPSVYAQPWPPGVQATQYLPQQPVTADFTYSQPLTFGPNVATNAAATSYNGDQIAGTKRIWSNAIRHLDAPYAARASTLHTSFQSKRRNNQRKIAKKTKVVQSAWCEVCKIHCTTKDVLGQHKLGKKHMKNLEKSKVAATTVHTTEAPSAHLLAHTMTPTEKSIGLIGSDAIKQLAAPSAAGVSTLDPLFQSKRQIKIAKKTKVLQSAWCEVCKIDCTTNDVLGRHQLGKKHNKNLEKSKVAASRFHETEAPSAHLIAHTFAPTQKSIIGPEENQNKSETASEQISQKRVAEKVEDLFAHTFAPTEKSMIGPDENQNKSETASEQKSQKRAAEKEEDLLVHTFAPTEKSTVGPEKNQNKSETSSEQKSQKRAAEKEEDWEVKKRKMLEGGVAADAVRACTVCNVVCNSEMVFIYHLVGKKHASMIKKHVSTENRDI